MNKKLRKIFIALTLLIAAFPILTFGTRSVVTFLWAILGIYLFVNHKNNRLGKDVLLLIFPFLILCITLFYSKNLNYGISLLVKMVSFLIFPLVFYLNRNSFSKKLISYVIYTFIFSVLILIFYQAISVFINFDTLFQNITPSEIKSNGFKSIEEISKTKLDQIKLRRFRNFIIEKSNTHTTYQGLWISFSLFILGLNIKNFKKNSFKLFAMISIIILIVWFYLISARMPLMAFLVTISLTVFIFSKLPKRKKILLLLSIPLAFSVLLLFKNPISTRFKEYYTNGLSIPHQKFESDRFNSSNVRNGVYFCDFQIIKENFFMGVGVGDIQDELNNCYSNKIGAKVYTWRDYNSHNQYAFFWISAGFIGFVGFIVFIVNIFIKSIRTVNIRLFYVICSSSIVFISENVLERSDGVVFFFFFIALLYYNKGLKAT